MKEVTDKDFETEVKKGKVLIKFYTPTCPPCRQIQPHLESLENIFSNIKFLTIDAKKNNESTLAASVRTVPTILLLKDGLEVSRFTGYRKPETIKYIIAEKIL